MAKKECRYCKKSITEESMYKKMHITRGGNITYHLFCDEICCQEESSWNKVSRTLRELLFPKDRFVGWQPNYYLTCELKRLNQEYSYRLMEKVIIENYDDIKEVINSKEWVHYIACVKYIIKILESEFREEKMKEANK